jgi:hypothetical protein
MDSPKYRDAVQALLNKGINFVGIDFDVSLSSVSHVSLLATLKLL